MKRILLITLVCICSLYSMANNLVNTPDTVKLEYSPEEIIGTWIALRAPNDTVEFKFEKRLIYSNLVNRYFEVILGSVKIKRSGYFYPINNEYILEKLKAPFVGYLNNPFEMYLTYFELGKNKDRGNGVFRVNPKNKTAKWTLINMTENWFGKKYDPFILSSNLSFQKKE